MRWVVPIAAALLAAAGCASTSTDAPQSSPPPPRINADPSQVVFRFTDDVGGFIGLEYLLGTRPTVTIYGNGDAYLSWRDRDRGYPGRPLAFVKGTVPATVLADLSRDANSSGLFNGADYGTVQITDVGSTLFTFHPGHGAARTGSVYALGIDDANDSLSPRQRANRQALQAFENRLVHSVVTPDGPPTAWLPDRVDVTLGFPGNPSGVSAAPWQGPPLDTLLTKHKYGRCGVLSGQDARDVYLAARRHRTTYWRDGGSVRELVIRALLPGEAGCRR
ncbi:MAG TPA: hypothetical protein VE442_13425 [Jatrophihabitans sp.]|nr:hypothetical protein [Jatrophihabitans sp.]